jgi:hypothetical protein
MRIYATAHEKDLKTVKSQGERIAAAWYEKRGTHVEVKAIKRTGNPLKHKQWGFVVLESIFGTYLCHYVFWRNDLTVTHESILNSDLPEYLECPEKILAMAEPENILWRDCVRTYQAAMKVLTPDRLAGNVTLFLKKCFETRQYGEPFFVVQRKDGDWFGIDCYGMAKYLSLNMADLYAHCPVLVDVQAQRPMSDSGLASDCVNTGILIYKQTGNHGVLLGRPKTRAEIVNENLALIRPTRFSLHGDCFWA